MDHTKALFLVQQSRTRGQRCRGLGQGPEITRPETPLNGGFVGLRAQWPKILAGKLCAYREKKNKKK